jgi:hypothetical protein
MLRLVDPTAAMPWWHPSERNLPAEAERTVFWIVPLTVGQDRRLEAALGGTAIGESALRAQMASYYERLFMSNVQRIENVMLPGMGTSCTIESEADKRKFLDALPAQAWPPIFQAIQSLSALDAGTVKNSADSSG